ncbi:TatA/E family twin arginine-targeting protein translocase [Cyanobium sp. Cruz CV13-4-11]|jgi:sec-independent protein translocase protein TatA|uniref:TatA/E family twin arginine-targeting protein translocase n=1 Tax=unclassified Cyanobium TaxID=2627006 RepID=UPI0020CF081E|nr:MULTISPECIES: TatA/E family twin arginine-targeting protein translocase [unclassified Cyanobium]MCP9899455.1 TatA/E family twin arginine-targeting protein translocase [Cyanobium sp. Cruz CV11-17]MCP9918798.1 TatA/E family twin arginine-targeting protein translocase [Cyanobium sp. Cruz CV13-4-11]
MNIFGIGLPEMAVIAAIGLLVFGPKRLPELGKTLGRTLRGFQSASQEFEKEFRTAVGTDQSIDISGPPAAIPPAADASAPAAVVEESAGPSS